MTVEKKITITLDKEEQKILKQTNEILIDICNDSGICDEYACHTCPIKNFCRVEDMVNLIENSIDVKINMGD